MSRTLVILTLSVLVAGCSASESASAPEGFAPEGEGGVLEVFVTDDSLRPLADVTVEVEGLPRAVNTTSDGLARFDDVPSGAYAVLGSLDGYETGAGSADVYASQLARVNLVLVALPSTKAYAETVLARMFIGCAFTLNDGMVRGSLECADPNHKVDVDLAFAPDWAQFVAKASWGRGGTSTNPEMRMSLYYLTLVAGNVSDVHSYADVPGPSPMKIVLMPATNHTDLGANTITPDSATGGPLNVTMWKEPMEVAGLKPLGVGFQQPVDTFFTTFFFAPNPNVESFSAMPDS